jgi:hypothetical protein
MRLDHLAYAAPSDHLADVVQRIGARLGAAFTDGGVHPRFGTRNFILPLLGGMYLEVVAALDHPAADNAPFGRAVKQRAEDGAGWLGWVVGVDDISTVEQRLGRSAVAGHRHRPDGFDISWRQIGVNDLIDNPQLPFFIQWEVDPSEHPSAGATGEVAVTRLEIAGDPALVNAWVGSTNGHPLDDVDVTWLPPDRGDVGLVAVHFDTPLGPVRLD